MKKVVFRKSSICLCDANVKPFNSSLTIKLWYDQLFKGKHGNDSLNVLRRVIAQTQTMFYWSSLNTTVTLTVKAVEEVPINFTAGADITSL
jgi:hypothetical protein